MMVITLNNVTSCITRVMEDTQDASINIRINTSTHQRGRLHLLRLPQQMLQDPLQAQPGVIIITNPVPQANDDDSDDDQSSTPTKTKRLR